MAKMTMEEFLEYGEQLEDKFYRKDNVEGVKADVKKLEEVLKRFGFAYDGAFDEEDYIIKKMRGVAVEEPTAWYYKLKTGEYTYIQVQLGWRYEYRYKTYWTTKYGKRRKYKKEWVYGIRGIWRVYRHNPEINPRTGSPYEIGDIKYHPSGGYSTTLTRHGWWSGD